MKNAIRNATLIKAMWQVSIVVAALFLLPGINAMGQLDVKKTSTPITINGNLSDCGWANANFVTFTNAVAGVPTLAATTLVTAITNTTATSGGNVTYDGGTSVTARGVCWATSQNPTTANSKTTNGTGTGTFTSSLTGLTLGTTYYVRAYATNTTGTGYGAQVSFTTTGGGGTCGTGYHAPCPPNSYVANVTNFGATGNDGQYGTDDTQAIQAAVNDVCDNPNHSGGTVLVPAGTYWVTASGAWPYPAIQLKSNLTFRLEAGATIKMKPTDMGTYTVLCINGNISNVNIVGAGPASSKIMGERHQHTGAYAGYDFINCQPDQCGAGEWGMGIWMLNVNSNIYIEGIEVREFWGDGICVGCCGSSPNLNVNIYNVICDDNRRQALSIIEVDGMTVRNSSFINTHGTAPQSGIDVEPMGGDGQRVDNLIIDQCSFTGNFGAGLVLEGNGGRNTTNHVTVTNCPFYDNRWQLVWRNPGTGSSYSGCTFGHVRADWICDITLPDESCIVP